MPRYVEAVQGAEIISEKMNIPLADLVDVFADIPTADVVPKSEVEALKEKLDATIAGQETLQKALVNAKGEVARKIFEEIEKYWIDSDTLPDCARLVDLDKIAELKKKYTEAA